MFSFALLLLSLSVCLWTIELIGVGVYTCGPEPAGSCLRRWELASVRVYFLEASYSVVLSCWGYYA